MKKIVYCILFALIFWSCSEDFLEKVNPNAITDASFWKTEQDALAGLTAAYSPLQARLYLHGSRGVLLSNVRGDDVQPRATGTGLAAFLNSSSNTGPLMSNADMWNFSYIGIYRANQVLENVINIDMDSQLKDRIIGEAHFLRGMYYFNLATLFKTVPLHLEVPKAREDFTLPRASENELWNLIFSDFKAAKDVLPEVYGSEDTGRATWGAATGMLGKSYLYREMWAEASAEFNEIITSGNYQLLSDYGNNFKEAYDFNQESLFEVAFEVGHGAPPAGLWQFDTKIVVESTVRGQEFAPQEIRGWFGMSPSQWIFNEFKKELRPNNDFDKRMYATFAWDYPGCVVYQKPFTERFSPNKFIWIKYMNPERADEFLRESGINEKVLRYADILLMYAEAEIMKSGVNAGAIDAINQIRNRAGLADYTGGNSKEEVLNEIMHQRALEFHAEGLRFQDLRRWGIIKETLLANGKLFAENFVEGQHEYLPIPQSEMDANPLLVQNNGF